MEDLAGKVGRIFRLPPGWHLFGQIAPRIFLLSRRGTLFAPLCLHSFRLLPACRASEAKKFPHLGGSYAQAVTVPERLRWLRHSQGLLQKEAAAQAGIPLPRYIDMETGACTHYPAATMDKLAALYQVSVEELLDEYNLFLYKGQACQIIALREKLGLSRTAFARQFGISERSLRAWESEKKVISKGCWEKYFRKLAGVLQ